MKKNDTRLCYTKMMSALNSDTDPKTEILQIRLLRSVPSWRKLEMLVQLNNSARLLALSGLRQRYPQAGEGELHRRLASLLLGDELASRVYGELKNAS
ncbi:MAG: hypothetical protein NTZ74_02140 [Chloroflexi bacterium]|nr:hypothetical protein [Chloroflexota bacterium]